MHVEWAEECHEGSDQRHSLRCHSLLPRGGGSATIFWELRLSSVALLCQLRTLWKPKKKIFEEWVLDTYPPREVVRKLENFQTQLGPDSSGFNVQGRNQTVFCFWVAVETDVISQSFWLGCAQSRRTPFLLQAQYTDLAVPR